MKISDIDKNLRVSETVDFPDLKWITPDGGYFRTYGCCSTQPYKRIPEEVAAAANEGVLTLHGNTAGVRLRFRTDSRYVAIHAEWHTQCCFPHMPVTGVSGFDLYRIKDGVQEFVGLIIPPFSAPYGYEGFVFTPGGMQDLILEFPLYNDVDKLYVGVSDTAEFEAPAEYSHARPVVYYGSSITQGGCASRPGNSYQAMLSRALDCDYINLGFSASARGEQAIARYIGGLDMSAFVLDYDHNAPNEEHLEKTHYPFYRTVRDARPDTPIIMLSKPDVLSVDPGAAYGFDLRREIIRKTYERAVAEGDKNVYFIDGASIFGDDPLRACTVDTCHPNDLGFYRYYEKLYPVLSKLI